MRTQYYRASATPESTPTNHRHQSGPQSLLAPARDTFGATNKGKRTSSVCNCKHQKHDNMKIRKSRLPFFHTWAQQHRAPISDPGTYSRLYCWICLLNMPNTNRCLNEDVARSQTKTVRTKIRKFSIRATLRLIGCFWIEFWNP